MILGKIQVRKLPEVFDGGSVIGASRVLGRIEIPEELEPAIRMNVCHPSVFLSPGDADTFEATGIVLSQPLIPMIVTMRGETEVSESVVTAIHVLVVNDAGREFSVHEKPSQMARKEPSTPESYDPVSGGDNAASNIPGIHAWFGRFEPHEQTLFRIVGKVLSNVGWNVHGRDYIKSLHARPLRKELLEAV